MTDTSNFIAAIAELRASAVTVRNEGETLIEKDAVQGIIEWCENAVPALTAGAVRFKQLSPND